MEQAFAGLRGNVDGSGRTGEKAVLTDEGIRLGLISSSPAAVHARRRYVRMLHLFRFVPLKVKSRGVEMRLIINGGDEPERRCLRW